jgi:hypothetical protein
MRAHFNLLAVIWWFQSWRMRGKQSRRVDMWRISSLETHVTTIQPKKRTDTKLTECLWIRHHLAYYLPVSGAVGRYRRFGEGTSESGGSRFETLIPVCRIKWCRILIFTTVRSSHLVVRWCRPKWTGSGQKPMTGLNDNNTQLSDFFLWKKFSFSLFQLHFSLLNKLFMLQ